MNGTDLRKLVKDFLDETDLTDFREMGAELARRIPSKDLRSVLAEALPDLLSTVNQQRRMSNPIIAGSTPARSAKVAGIAAMHAAALRALVHVGGGTNKHLGDCTYEDLMFAARERREHARRNAAKADKYEELASKLQSLRLTTVAELAPTDLSGLEAAA